jgi:hypothetical protein
VQVGESIIKHCGIENMIIDYFTKPLQGSRFSKFRDLIIGITDIDSTDQIRSVLEKDLIPNTNSQNDPNLENKDNMKQMVKN